MIANETPYEVLVVVDPDFGDRLRQVPVGKPVRITMSDANAPFVRAIWTECRNPSDLHGVTGFTHQDADTPEDRLLGQLDAVDIHHGPYSAQPPYTILTVVGATATPEVGEALLDLGFRTIERREGGFTARRSFEEAQRTRD